MLELSGVSKRFGGLAALSDISFKVGGGNVLTLCPPLTITQAELDAAFDVVDRAME